MSACVCLQEQLYATNFSAAGVTEPKSQARLLYLESPSNENKNNDSNNKKATATERFVSFFFCFESFHLQKIRC